MAAPSDGKSCYCFFIKDYAIKKHFINSYDDYDYGRFLWFLNFDKILVNLYLIKMFTKPCLGLFIAKINRLSVPSSMM